MRVESALSVGDLAKLVAQDAKTLRAQVQRDPVVRKRVAELRDTCAAAVAESDDELAAVILGAADAVSRTQCEGTEPRRRVFRTVTTSAALGYCVVETPLYLYPLSHRCYGARSGSTLGVVRL